MDEQSWVLYNSDGDNGATELQQWLPGGTSGTEMVLESR